MARSQPRSEFIPERIVRAPVAPDGEDSPMSVREALTAAGSDESAVRRFDQLARSLDEQADSYVPREPPPGSRPYLPAYGDRGREDLRDRAKEARRRRDSANAASMDNANRLPGGALFHDVARAADGADIAEPCPVCGNDLAPADLDPELWILEVVQHRRYQDSDRFGVLVPTCSEICRDTAMRPGRYRVDPILRIPFAVPPGRGNASTRHAHTESSAYGRAARALTRSATLIRQDLNDAPVLTYKDALRAVEEVEKLHHEIQTLGNTVCEQADEIKRLQSAETKDQEDALDG